MIDWHKKLECEYGKIEAVYAFVSYNKVTCEGVDYKVSKDTGVPLSPILSSSFTVRNVTSIRDRAIERVKRTSSGDIAVRVLTAEQAVDRLIDGGFINEEENCNESG